MSENVLVHINTAESGYVLLKTYERKGGRSVTFYIAKEKLQEAFASCRYVLKHDCGNFVRMMADGQRVRMEFTWISGGMARRQWVYLDQADLEYLIYDTKAIVKRLSKPPEQRAEITLSKSAHELIAKLNGLERRALSKALRTAFS